MNKKHVARIVRIGKRALLIARKQREVNQAQAKVDGALLERDLWVKRRVQELDKAYVERAENE